MYARRDEGEAGIGVYAQYKADQCRCERPARAEWSLAIPIRISNCDPSVHGETQKLMIRHERDARAYTTYGTFTVTIATLRPYWLLANSVYVVVCVGLTLTLLPRTAPGPGETIT